MNFPSLLSRALMGKTGNKFALWDHPPVRQRLLIIHSTLIFILEILELHKSLKSVSVPRTQGFYVARYCCLAYNNAKTFIDVKKAPSLAVWPFTTENICRSKKGVVETLQVFPVSIYLVVD